MQHYLVGFIWYTDVDADNREDAIDKAKEQFSDNDCSVRDMDVFEVRQQVQTEEEKT